MRILLFLREDKESFDVANCFYFVLESSYAFLFEESEIAY